jgi:hypothetical protein
LSGVARAGRILFWIYLVLLFIVTMSEGSFLRGNIIYPVGFHRWMTALYVLVCAAWFEGALRYYFSGRAELEVNRREAHRNRWIVLIVLALAIGLGWYVATENRWAPWAFLACGLYWAVRYVQLRRGRPRGYWGKPFGTGLGVQIPLAACIITFGYWMFVLVNYHLVEMADDWLGRARGTYAGMLVDRGEAGGLLDLGTCPSVIVRIERGGRAERHQICSNRIGLSPGLGAGQPVLVSGRHGIFGFAVDQIAAAPPGGPGAPR